MVTYSPNYAFPHVAVSESIVGPVSVETGYRKTIGIAGTFSKGPLGAVFINDRDTFNQVYGEDDSPGAVFVKTAMRQGATDFVISRVLPSAKTSKAILYLQANNNPTFNEGVTANSDNRTVGLKLNLSFISNATILRGQYLGSNVSVDKAPLTLPGLEGVLNYDFKVLERIDNSTVPTKTIDVVVPAATTNTTTTVRKITVTGSTLADFLEHAKPGKLIKNGNTFTNIDGNGFKVLTYPKFESTGVYSVLVQGQASPGTYTGSTLEPYGSTDVYFILGVNSRTAEPNVLPLDILKNVDYYPNIVADTFLIVKSDVKSSQPIKLINYDGTDYTLLNPNINVAIGDSTSSSNTELVINSSFIVNVIQTSIEIGENNTSATNFPNTLKAFGRNISASEILTNLQQAISQSVTASRLLSDYNLGFTNNVSLNTESLPYTLNLTSSFTGNDANRIYLNLTRTVQGSPTDLLFGASGIYYGTDISFAGGQDGLSYASKYFYDSLGNPLVLIQAVSLGKTGNNIKVTIKPDVQGQFKLDVFDTTIQSNGQPGKTESYLLNNFTVDSSTGFYSETIDSTLIRAFFIPVSLSGSLTTVSVNTLNLTPQRLAPPISTLATSSDLSNLSHPSHRGVSYLKDIYLQGGYEPNVNGLPAEEDYINAIKALETADVSFITTDNLYFGDARYSEAHSELISQAERSTTINGLRTAILACPPRMTKGRVRTVKAGVSSSRVQFIAGWATSTTSRLNSFNGTSPTGFYVGKLATVPPHISPASMSEAGGLSGIATVDHTFEPDYLNELTLNGIDAIVYDTGSNSFKILNGLNSASVASNDDLVSIRRQADHLITLFYRNLQWARSAKNDDFLRSRVSTSCDAILESQRSEGRISSFTPTVCDRSNNNNNTIIKRELYVRVTWTPYYPADKIKVSTVRDITSEFSLNI